MGSLFSLFPPIPPPATQLSGRSTVRGEWTKKFRTWSRPASDSEQTRKARTEKMIRAVVRNHPLFRTRRCRVFVQGSFRNNTNVRTDSDVDICVVLEAGEIFIQLDVKQALQGALEKKFGSGNVSRGNMVLKVRETQKTRVSADVLLATPFYRPGMGATLLTGSLLGQQGIVILPDDGGKIISYPDQHHKNGVAKNRATQGSFKTVVRILKWLRNTLQDEFIITTDTTPSYLVESLVYNCPDRDFTGLDIYRKVETVLLRCLAAVQSETLSRGWTEVNEIKPLFDDQQSWTREGALIFLGRALEHIQFNE